MLLSKSRPHVFSLSNGWLLSFAVKVCWVLCDNIHEYVCYNRFHIKYCNIRGFFIHDGRLLHSKVQYTTVDYSPQLF
jgi:hypothetical protein